MTMKLLTQKPSWLCLLYSPLVQVFFYGAMHDYGRGQNEGQRLSHSLAPAVRNTEARIIPGKLCRTGLEFSCWPGGNVDQELQVRIYCFRKKSVFCTSGCGSVERQIPSFPLSLLSCVCFYLTLLWQQISAGYEGLCCVTDSPVRSVQRAGEGWRSNVRLPRRMRHQSTRREEELANEPAALSHLIWMFIQIMTLQNV